MSVSLLPKTDPGPDRVVLAFVSGKIERDAPCDVIEARKTSQAWEREQTGRLHFFSVIFATPIRRNARKAIRWATRFPYFFLLFWSCQVRRLTVSRRLHGRGKTYGMSVHIQFQERKAGLLLEP